MQCLCDTLYITNTEAHLPQQLRHVQNRLRNRELIDRAGPLRFRQAALQLSKLAPSGTVFRGPLQVLGVQCAAPLDVAQLQLDVDVGPEDLVLWAHAQSCAQNLPR